jgi:hypothetical protein
MVHAPEGSHATNVARTPGRAATILVATLLAPPVARAQDDGPAAGWVTTFGQDPGVDELLTVHVASVRALASVDHGDGRRLYVGGTLDRAGGVGCGHVACWDGRMWRPVGAGLDGWVHALAGFDEGGRTVLVAGGEFGQAGGAPAAHVARWDGATWSPFGAGLDESVRALAVHDDGSGPALYAAGGDFTQFGGDVGTGFVRRWDGNAWLPVGSQPVGPVDVLAVHDDGSGPALYAGGEFGAIDGLPAAHVARWDGAQWSALGTGTDARVRALAGFDDGSGPALYAGGDFTSAGGSDVGYVARWQGGAWSTIGSFPDLGVGAPVHVLAVVDDGSGASLLAGGDFVSTGLEPADHVARWTGVTWEGLTPDGSGPHGPVLALASFGNGSGDPWLVAGGRFAKAGDDVVVDDVARYGDGAWSALGRGVDSSILALAAWDDGGGTALYAGGWLETAGEVPLANIGRWDGDGWSPLGEGIDPDGPAVQALAVWDDGNGEALYAGGGFDVAGGQSAHGVARWDGDAWSALGTGIEHHVYSLATWDDGTGPALYAAGLFDEAGGVPANNIARWDGVAWSPLGAGTSQSVYVLATYDDGQGEALYAAGTFQQAGGSPAKFVARWDGSGWSPLGAGLDGQVDALAVYDDGGGPALYAGGWFATAGGVPAPRLARWDGAAWSAPGVTLDASAGHVKGLATFDDGSGPALVVAGALRLVAHGSSWHGLARWDGVAWTPLAGEVGTVHTMLGAAIEGAGGPALYAGGTFGSLGRSRDSYLARWMPAPSRVAAAGQTASGAPAPDGRPALALRTPFVAGGVARIELRGAPPSAVGCLVVGVAERASRSDGSPTTRAAELAGGVVLPCTADRNGAASIVFPVPESLPAGATLRWRWAGVDPDGHGDPAWSDVLDVVAR